MLRAHELRRKIAKIQFAYVRPSKADVAASHGLVVRWNLSKAPPSYYKSNSGGECLDLTTYQDTADAYNTNKQPKQTPDRVLEGLSFTETRWTIENLLILDPLEF